jgi:hypothetical protein
MTQSNASLPDRVIEVALERRVAGHADEALLAAIVGATARTPQVRAWPAFVAGRPRLTWAVLAAAVLVVAGLIVVGTGAVRLTPPPPPLPSPFAVVPDASNPARVGSSCPAADMVALGADMSPAYANPMTIPDGVLDRGVYLTETSRGSQDPTNLWAISSGAATRIAQVTGASYSLQRAGIGDLSPDGRNVLLGVDAVQSATCHVSFVLAADGSRIVRMIPGPAESASFSTSGRFVQVSNGNEILVFEAEGDAPPQRYPCQGDRASITPRWAPDGDRLLAECNSTTQVIDPLTVSTTTIAPPWRDAPHFREQVWDLGWIDPSTFFVVSSLSDPDTVTHWRTVSLPAGAAASAAAAAWSQPIQGDVAPVGKSVSPDGRTSAVWADSHGTQEGSDGMLVDIATGHATRFARNVVAVDEPIVWSTDGRSILWRLPPGGVDPDSHLVIHDVATGQETMPGDLPFSIVQGIWRLP